jgi:hypothetical protein
VKINHRRQEPHGNGDLAGKKMKPMILNEVARIAGYDGELVAVMMIEDISQSAVKKVGSTRSEIGGIHEDNQGMNSIVEMVNSTISKA